MQVLNELLEKIKDASGIAVFDFDNTVLSGDIGETFLWYLAEHRKFKIDFEFLKSFQTKRSKSNLLNTADNKIDDNHPLIQKIKKDYANVIDENFKLSSYDNEISALIIDEYFLLLEKFGGPVGYPWSAVCFSGYNNQEIAEITTIIAAKEYQEKKYAKFNNNNLEFGFFPASAMVNLIKNLRLKNIPVIVVTASPEVIVREYLKLNPQIEVSDVVGMKIIEENNILTSKVKFPMTSGQGKVDALRIHYQEDIVLCAGDSYSDLELLQEGKISLLIDKGDEDILKFAKEKNWLIIKQSIFNVT